MKQKTIVLTSEDIKVNEHNPRVIKRNQLGKLVQSLKEFPDMMKLRPIIVDENNVILGGNMRYQALKKMGVDEFEVTRVEGLTEDQKKEFIVKDNLPYGEWNVDELANGWEIDQLKDWGLNIDFDDIGNKQKQVNGIDLKEMELKPFEHYDYIMFLFKDQLDFCNACQVFGVEKVVEKYDDARKVGIGRCVDGRKLLEAIGN